jgi:antirestriction protein
MTKQTELTDAQAEVLNEACLDIPTEIALEYISDTGDDDLSNIQEAYAGSYNSDREFAMDMAEQVGDIPNDLHWPFTCIDWEWAAKELMMDYSVYVTKEYARFYFRNL